MIIIILLLLLTFGFIYCIFKEALDISEGMIGSLIASIIMILLIITPILISYTSYLNMKAFYESTYEQYSESIEIYQDKAIIDTEVAFTDFKYQGYQDNISSYVRDFRNKMIWYNELYIKKTAMNQNIFVNWLIIPPDENMKLMQMK